MENTVEKELLEDKEVKLGSKFRLVQKYPFMDEYEEESEVFEFKKNEIFSYI